jgi:hypothetical protein
LVSLSLALKIEHALVNLGEFDFNAPVTLAVEVFKGRGLGLLLDSVMSH